MEKWPFGNVYIFWDFICVRLALKTPRLPFLFPGCFLNVSTSKIAHRNKHRVKQPGSWGCLGRLPTPTPKGCIRDMLSVQLWLLFVCNAKCFCKIHVICIVCIVTSCYGVDSCTFIFFWIVLSKEYVVFFLIFYFFHDSFREVFVL